MSIILIVVVVSWVYAYVKIYIVYRLYLNKAVKNLKRKGCTISAHLKLIYAAFDLYNIKK